MKAKVVWLAGKAMVSIFWDAKGILLIYYLPTGQTITGQYYATTGKDTQKKKARFGKEKSHLSSAQCLPAHKCYCHGKNP
jgi:Transposase.